MKIALSRTSLACLVLVLLASCNLTSPLAGPGENAVASAVAATLQSMAPSLTKAPLYSPTAAEPTIGATQEPASTLEPTSTGIPVPGTIEGNIVGYPYGALPLFTIVAYEQESPYNYSYIQPLAGSSFYSMTSDYLIPGTWQVIAYDRSGHAGGCTTIVTVKSNQTVTCDITDWAGAYRARPAGVP